MTAEIIEQLRRKDDLMIHARETNMTEDWAEAKRAKNAAKLLITNAKASFMHKALANNRYNSKAFWRTINEILPNEKAGNNDINLLGDDGSCIPPSEAAKHINDFFTNIAAKLDTKNTPWVDPGLLTDNSFNLNCANMTELK